MSLEPGFDGKMKQIKQNLQTFLWQTVDEYSMPFIASVISPYTMPAILQFFLRSITDYIIQPAIIYVYRATIGFRCIPK